VVERAASAWTTNRVVAMVIGVVFLIIGILGLIFDTTHGSILGFEVDLVHNLFHLVTGILGIAAAMTGWSRFFNQVFGIIYLLLGLAGLIPALYFGHRLLGLIHVDAADNVLHLVVGVVAAGVGFFVHDEVTRGVTGTRGTTDGSQDPMARP
jgi:Domain of unknown function (DUF4383)